MQQTRDPSWPSERKRMRYTRPRRATSANLWNVNRPPMNGPIPEPGLVLNFQFYCKQKPRNFLFRWLQSKSLICCGTLTKTLMMNIKGYRTWKGEVKIELSSRSYKIPLPKGRRQCQCTIASCAWCMYSLIIWMALQDVNIPSHFLWNLFSSMKLKRSQFDKNALVFTSTQRTAYFG